ncbi:NAD(P)-dependent alcohol dehydrogenase [Nonomuraea sp. NN258]|nr:NAD(P)-dependent alcohol dehydrogenase [Nonomuraea antri]
MKAIVQDDYCSPDLLRLGEVERPAIAGDDDVLLRVQAAGIDQGVWHSVTGLPYPVRFAGIGLRRPKSRVPGLDVAGRVEAVGRNVTRFQPGDEVFGTCDGAFAEYARTTQDRLVPRPPGLSPEQAACLPTSGCAALQGLRDAGGLRPGPSGPRVLVIGAAGAVGSFAVQLAKSMDAHVTGVCSGAKTDLVRTLGADEIIDYGVEDVTRTGRRYDLILDTGGHRKLSHLRRALTPRGTLVIVGSECRGGRWLQGTDRQLRAALWSTFIRQNLRPLLSAARQDDLRELADLAAAGRVTPALDRTFPLAETAAAIQYVRGGQVRGKVAVSV